ncbi:MAG: ROK family protein [Anaerolineales bacterium]|nr:ROK family protein [Anaerolineales bacterium]
MAKKPYFIGVDFGGTSIRAGVVDKDGNVIGFEKRKTQAELGTDVVFERLAVAIERAMRAADVKARQVGGIGIGVPGPVDQERGVVRVLVNLGKGWTNYPLVDRLERRLGLPAWLENDVRVGALGEYHHGAGQGLSDMVAIFVGTGIGGGIILNGELRTGFRGGAGEVGHTCVNGDDGVIDVTGQTGTVEGIAGRAGLERQIREAIAAGQTSVVPDLMQTVGAGRLTSRVVVEALKQGDAPMQSALAAAQRALGRCAGNVMNIIDPEMIVFGGGVTERLGDKFVAPIRKFAQEHYVARSEARRIKIVPGQLKDLAGVVGASVAARKFL